MTVVGVLAGAVATAFLVTAAFISAAEDIGKGMSEGMAQSMQETLSGTGPEGVDNGAVTEPYAVGPVEEFPPVQPGDLGPDPVLDAYAESCFTGDLQACDDLWFESPPMSDYENYAGTCGGRVKRQAVMACGDLE
jgi:hypothetical protein